MEQPSLLQHAPNLVRIQKGGEWKTTLNTPLGHSEYLVMSFELTNAPAVFNALVNGVLRDWPVYLCLPEWYRDFLVQEPGHILQYMYVRNRQCKEKTLFVNAEKCEFQVSSITFLGYVSEGSKVKADPDKVKAESECPRPTLAVILGVLLQVLLGLQPGIHPAHSAYLSNHLLPFDPWSWCHLYPVLHFSCFCAPGPFPTNHCEMYLQSWGLNKRDLNLTKSCTLVPQVSPWGGETLTERGRRSLHHMVTSSCHHHPVFSLTANSSFWAAHQIYLLYDGFASHSWCLLSHSFYSPSFSLCCK